MTAYKSDFLNVLASRGYVHQVSDADGLDTLLREQLVGRRQQSLEAAQKNEEQGSVAAAAAAGATPDRTALKRAAFFRSFFDGGACSLR